MSASDDSPNRPICSDNPETVDVVEEALTSLWSVANKLSRIRPSRRERYSVTVFGSSRIRPGGELYEDVKRLTTVLSQMRCDIVTGGGPGLMQAANEGAQIGDPEDVARSIGVRVALPFEKEANPFVEQVYTHQTFYTRLHHFVRLSDAFVVVGGGIGTTLELLLIWQLLQVRHIDSLPLILVGDMWRELVGWAQKHMIDNDPPLANAEDVDLTICVDTVDQAVELLRPRIETFNAGQSTPPNA